MNPLSYIFIYKILFDYISRDCKNFLFQFFIHRYIEVTSILLAVVVSNISPTNSPTIIGAVGLVHLVLSLMINEGYTKIVPYIRALWLNSRIVPLYLLLNTLVPFMIYLMLLMVTVPEAPTIQDVLLMSTLLFCNTLFAHFLHIFSFSLKNAILYLPLVISIYLAVFIQIHFLVVLSLAVVAVILFISKARHY